MATPVVRLSIDPFAAVPVRSVTLLRRPSAAGVNMAAVPGAADRSAVLCTHTRQMYGENILKSLECYTLDYRFGDLEIRLWKPFSFHKITFGCRRTVMISIFSHPSQTHNWLQMKNL